MFENEFIGNNFIPLRTYSAAIVAILLSAYLLCAQTPDPLIADVVAKMDKHLTDGEIKGFSGSFLLIKDGKVLLQKGYGFADCQRTKKTTTEMVFDIGSLTKPITAVAILKLQSKGKLKVEDPISRHLDGVPADKAAITILQLLRHQSGMQDVFGADEDYVTKDWFLKKAFESKLRFKPGEPGDIDDTYSNAGYSLLGAIIEKVSGVSYEEYVSRNLFEPIGLKNTGYRKPNWKSERVVCGFRDEKPWGSVRDFYGKTEPSWNLLANGGMMSTVSELNTFFTAIVQDKILPKAEKDFYLETAAKKGRTGRRTMSPSGNNNIFSSLYVNFIDDGVSMVYFTSDNRFSLDGGFPQKLFPDLNRLLPPVK